MFEGADAYDGIVTPFPFRPRRRHGVGGWAVVIVAACVFFAGMLWAAMAWAQSPSRPTNVTAATVTNSSTQMVPAHQRQYLAILNQSSTATIACNFGGTAAINTAGSFTLAPLGGFVWDNAIIPSNAINCISSVASSPATIQE